MKRGSEIDVTTWWTTIRFTVVLGIRIKNYNEFHEKGSGKTISTVSPLLKLFFLDLIERD